MSRALIQQWHAAFEGALPAGFLCRQTLTDRWLRIHSLPESRRYADTRADYAELLRRQNEAATYLLGEGSDCVIFITRFGDAVDWRTSEALPLSDTPRHVLTALEDEEQLQFFALSVTWRRQAFDRLITAVADDQTGPLLFANLQQRTIYAPYDGGADLFFPQSDALSSARRQFKDWLPIRDDGL